MKTDLPARTIKAAVELKLGPVSDFEQLPEGLVSQTYGFRQGPSQFIARVSRSLVGFRKDAFAWRAFCSAALPIPEVLGIDSIGDLALCISRRAHGVRVSDLDPDSSTLAPAIVEILAELGRTDASRTVGFGSFDEAGKAPCQTWHDYLMRVSDERLYDWASISDRLDGGRVDQAIRFIERLAPDHPPHRGLIHGDFGAANLISDGRAITAVIDWDRAMMGDVAYDEANLFFWGEPHLQPVLSLLMSRHSDDADWMRRMFCYQLRIGLEELYDSIAGRNPVDSKWLMARCADLADQAHRIAG
jgi:hygromycin-B 4-O-kinase